MMTTDDLYRSLNDGSRTERVERFLTELITSGKLASGDLLPSEPALGKQLGVSRPTIRLALRTLETRGLITIRQGIGAQVTDRTREVATDSISLMLRQAGADEREMLEIRLMLESQGAAWAAERADGDAIAAMTETIDAMRQDSLSIDQLIALDFDFHLRLHEASKNHALIALVQAIRSVLLDTIADAWEFNPRRDTRLEEHARILAAVSAHDPVAARAAMEDHLYLSAVRQGRAFAGN